AANPTSLRRPPIDSPEHFQAILPAPSPKIDPPLEEANRAASASMRFPGSHPATACATFSATDPWQIPRPCPREREYPHSTDAAAGLKRQKTGQVRPNTSSSRLRSRFGRL